jgi:hypothetical protein
MIDDEFLEPRRKDLEESVKYFGSDNKPQREMWVVSEFLGNLGISISNGDLTPVSDDPPDVLFGNAGFEVKEIMDTGRRRHTEYKKALAKVRKATNAQELLEHYTPRDATLTEIYKLVRSEAENRAKHYDPKVCASLDLLFYVNLQDVMGLADVPYPDVTALRALPWRSVSFVIGWRSCVLVARVGAPEFLNSAVGQVTHRPVSQ